MTRFCFVVPPSIWRAPTIKILLIDIETAPNKVYAWGLFKQNISINQIVEPGYTMCWAAKWYGQRKVLFDSIHESTPRQMVMGAHKLLDEADVVVHYNGQRFDIPKLNGEFMYHKIQPPSPYKQLDLLKTTRQQFGFASNKLDYVTQHLDIGAKVKHLGMDLWRDCMADCPKAWKTMKRYNIQDVRLLEDYYERLLPWITNHPNWGMYLDAERPTCRNCGSGKMQKRGYQETTTLVYRRYQCKNCGRWGRGRKSVKRAADGITV